GYLRTPPPVTRCDPRGRLRIVRIPEPGVIASLPRRAGRTKVQALCPSPEELSRRIYQFEGASTAPPRPCISPSARRATPALEAGNQSPVTTRSVGSRRSAVEDPAGVFLVRAPALPAHVAWGKASEGRRSPLRAVRRPVADGAAAGTMRFKARDERIRPPA